MSLIELHFPVLGTTLPSDHGYELYGALARLLPRLHEPGTACRVGPIAGTYTGNGLLRLDARRSRLRLRLPADDIPRVLPLAGKALDAGGHRLRLGVPQVRGLVPAPALVARLVTIKGFTEPGPFLGAVRRQLDALEVRGEAGIPLTESGPHQGLPRRHVLRVKDKRVVGFTLQVTGLTAEESLRLQEKGLGGRSKMGCGFFVPLREI